MSRPRLILLLLLASTLALATWLLQRPPLLPGYQVEARPLLQRVVASGEVDSQSLARVGSEITAVVEQRHVREGDTVRAGDLLISLRDEEPQARLREAEAALRQLVDSARPQAEAALREAASNLEQARRERSRRDALFERQLLSAEQREQARRAETSARSAFERAQLAATALAAGGSEETQLRERLAAARAALARTRILAQVDGIVQSRSVEPGDLVQPGRTLLEIARQDSRELIVPLDEKNLAPVRLGQRAEVIADAYPAQVLAAEVSFIAPAVDSSRGTLDVHLRLLEEAAFLRQGMSVSVSIETGRREQALAIPRDALFQINGDDARVLRLRDGRVEKVQVRLGLQGAALVEALEGVQAGDQLLAVEQPAGSRVRLALRPLPGTVD